MRAVVQRVSRAAVKVDGQTVGLIGAGLLVYVGVAAGDRPEEARWLAAKIADLRIFKDCDDKMNLSVRDVRGGVLAVSNFTVLADARKGRRPAFVNAARPELAETLFRDFLKLLRDCGCTVQTGTFGASMAVDSIADGPVNIVLDTPDIFATRQE